MVKKSKKLGKSISSKAEVQNISEQGIWILVNKQEFLMRLYLRSFDKINTKMHSDTDDMRMHQRT